MTLFLTALLVALAVSFVCSLLEAALLSLTPSQIARMAERHPSAAAAWQGFKRNIERPIAVILILNTTAHTIGASVAGAQFDQLYGGDLLWAFSIGFTLVMLQFTEILPKTVGVRLNTVLAPWMAAPLRAMVFVFTPLIVVLHWINRPFEGRRRAGAERSATVDEIAALAAMARMAKDIGAHQERVILGAARLSEKRVRDLMIPVEQVVMLSDDMPLPRAIVAAHLDAHTRFPICAGGDRDRVLGYVNFKEMIYFMSANPRDPSLKGIMRPITRVLPDESAASLMRIFVEEHEHIAIAQDPDGRAAGLVTLEDLVEELIGDLQDELDRLPRYSHALSGGTWLFGGGVPMEEAARATGGLLPAAPGLMASWVEERLGKAPAGGQTLRVDGVEIAVRRVRRGRVFEVSVAAA